MTVLLVFLNDADWHSELWIEQEVIGLAQSLNTFGSSWSISLEIND